MYTEKEELAIWVLRYLLENDKDALLRVMSEIKRAILEEEANALAQRAIGRAKDNGWEPGL